MEIYKTKIDDSLTTFLFLLVIVEVAK